MCVIWPDELETISSTRIFARHDGERQLLVYQMDFDARAEVAMTLPVPIAQPGREDSLVFVNMDDNADFFETLKRIAPAPTPFRVATRGGGMLDGDDADDSVLAVVDLGDFIATFVPTQKDFDRVDSRFVLPQWFWQQNAQYADWGFAVVQLKPQEQRVARGQSRPHPIAFVFEKDAPDLYFPTLHLHGAALQPRAHFDHSLFAQGIAITDTSTYDEALHAEAERRFYDLRMKQLRADPIPQETLPEGAPARDAPPKNDNAFDEDTLETPMMRGGASDTNEMAASHHVTDDVKEAEVILDAFRAAQKKTWMYNGKSAGAFVSYPSLRELEVPAFADIFKGYADFDARLCRRDINGIADNTDIWVAAQTTERIDLSGPWGKALPVR